MTAEKLITAANIASFTNLCFPTLSDSYKAGGHAFMLPEDVKVVSSYFEMRSGSLYPYGQFFGLQYPLKQFFVGKVLDAKMIAKARKRCISHFGDDEHFNAAGWERLLEKHGGVLPVRIRAVEEGTVIPIGNVLMDIENLDPEFPWLTNFLETLLTMYMWYMSTVATRSFSNKVNIWKSLEVSSDLTYAEKRGLVQFMCHDFGMRSATCLEQASIGGAAHLVNSLGTDTMPAMDVLEAFYGVSDEDGLGYSVAASEHSIATAKGPFGEKAYIQRLLKRFKKGILSLVADSYDVRQFVQLYIKELKDEIMQRWLDGPKSAINRVVIRPDSKRFAGDSPAAQCVWLHEELWRIFGGKTNSKGYKVLHPCIGVIYGDGLSEVQIKEAYEAVVQSGFSVENFVVGQGGGLMQKLDRDTQRCAFKCSAQLQGEEWVDVIKMPLDKTKASKGGQLALVGNGKGSFKTIRRSEAEKDKLFDHLRTVFENGVLVNEMTFNEVRENAENAFHSYISKTA